MPNILKACAALALLSTTSACFFEEKDADQSIISDILLYCTMESAKPVKLVSDDDGSEFEAKLNYDGFYLINFDTQTMAVKQSGAEDFRPLCHKDGACKLLSSKFEIRFENHGREYDGKTYNETYVIDRVTRAIYMKTDVSGPDAGPTTYARGSCRKAESTDKPSF